MNSSEIKNEAEIARNLPWYKHGWVWFIIFLPSSVVVASFVTLYIAIVNAPEKAIDYEHYSKPVISEPSNSHSSNTDG